MIKKEKCHICGAECGTEEFITHPNGEISQNWVCKEHATLDTYYVAGQGTKTRKRGIQND